MALDSPFPAIVYRFDLHYGLFWCVLTHATAASPYLLIYTQLHYRLLCFSKYYPFAASLSLHCRCGVGPFIFVFILYFMSLSHLSLFRFQEKACGVRHKFKILCNTCP